MTTASNGTSNLLSFFLWLLGPGPYRVLAVLLVLTAPVSAGREGNLSPLLDASGDEVVRSAAVPSALFPQAEVRLIRRDGSVVMQTVIVSRWFKRVVGGIRRKESSAWTAGRAEHRDSERYVDALERAYQTVEGRFREQESRGDRRRKLLIEFILSGETAIVVFLDPDIEGDFGGFRIGRRELLEILPLSRHYVRENMHEIAMDSMDLSRREAEETLKPLLPPALQQEGVKRKRDEN